MAYRKVMLQIGMGLLIPVGINTAIEKEESFKTVCVGTDPKAPHIPTTVRQRTACPAVVGTNTDGSPQICDNDDRTLFKKARATGSTLQIVEAEDVSAVKEAAVGVTNKIMQLSVHPVADVRELSIQGGSVYYLTPDNQGVAPHLNALRDALFRHPELALLGIYSPAGKPNLYELKLYGDTLVLEERARAEAIKILQQPVAEVPELFQKQLDVILSSLTVPYTPETYQDDVKAQLNALVDKAEAQVGDVGTKKATVTPIAGGMDLTAMLAASMEALGAEATPAKKAAARKPRARKTAAA